MLRDLLNNGQKSIDATYKAHAALKRGMAVVKAADGKTGFIVGTGSENAVTDGDLAGVYLVDRDNLPTTVSQYAIEVQSDYEYDAVAEGALVKLVPYVKGEMFATDQITGALVDGDYLTVGVDGKFAKAAAATRFVCRGTTFDGNGTLTKIEVRY